MTYQNITSDNQSINIVDDVMTGRDDQSAQCMMSRLWWMTLTFDHDVISLQMTDAVTGAVLTIMKSKDEIDLHMVRQKYASSTNKGMLALYPLLSNEFGL